MFDDDESHVGAAGFLLGAAASAAAFAVLSDAVRRRKLSEKDRKALKKAKGNGAARGAAAAIQPLGKWWSYVPAAMLVGGVVMREGDGNATARGAGAASIVFAAIASAVVNPLFDELLPQPPSPPGKAPREPTFPSGHTFGLGAVAATAAYVLARHGVLSPAAAAPMAIVPPLVGGVAKMAEEKHWASDVAGGLLVAMCIAGVSLAGYEIARRNARGRATS